jgi:hypothetical protein
MPKLRRMLIMTSMLAAIVLAAVACGSEVDTADTADIDANAVTAGDTTSDQDTGELPVVSDDQVVDTPVVAGMCAPGEPDCEDTLVIDPPVKDLPPPDDEEEVTATADDSGSSGMTIDGGLTISEALATDATGILAVKGHFYDDGTGPGLCEGLIGLGERYGCDGEYVSITNFDNASAGMDLVIHDGLTYTEELVTVFGELVDGSLAIDNLVAG